jgi:hypothetical protein
VASDYAADRVMQTRLDLLIQKYGGNGRWGRLPVCVCACVCLCVPVVCVCARAIVRIAR